MDSPTPTWSRVLRLLALLLTLACLPVSAAYAAGGGEQTEARAYFDKASAAFALGHYPMAADNYEKAFELKPDPALIYNAAQAHRLAGNKERALVLYQNYLRLYAKAVRRSEVETRVEELKKAIERDRQLATSPPTTTMPSAMPPASDPTVAPAPVVTAPAAAAPVASPAPLPAAVDTRPPAPVLVAKPEPAEAEKRSLLQKPLFWGAVGGVVAAAVVVVLIVALGGPKDPTPSLGTVK